VEIQIGAGIDLTCKISIFFLNKIDDLRVQFDGIDVLNAVIVCLQNITAGTCPRISMLDSCFNDKVRLMSFDPGSSQFQDCHCSG